MSHSDVCLLLAVILFGVLTLMHVVERAVISALTMLAFGLFALSFLLD